jgi:hypothetical protein
MCAFCVALLGLLGSACGSAGVRTVTVTVTRTTKAASLPGPLVYTETGEGALAYQPDHMPFFDSQGSGIDHIRWTTWGGQFAVGHGEFWRETCNPNCANGPSVNTPITITLSNRGRCEGVTAYLDWTIKGIRPGGEYEPRGAILAAAFRAAKNGSSCYG